MSATRIQRARISLVCASFLTAALLGCATSTTAPADSHLSGNWRLDRSASDDPQVLIAKAMNVAQAKLRRRLAKYGYPPPDQGTDQGAGAPPGQGPEGAPDAPDFSFDTPGDRFGGPGLVGPDFRGLQTRLNQALIPPGSVHLEVQDDVVTIVADQLPPREYHVGEKLSRIDEYGTAIIMPSFSHEQFVLKSNYTTYTSHAQRIETYEVNPASGALMLTEQVSDPTVGRIIVHSVYRRS